MVSFPIKIGKFYIHDMSYCYEKLMCINTSSKGTTNVNNGFDEDVFVSITFNNRLDLLLNDFRLLLASCQDSLVGDVFSSDRFFKAYISGCLPGAKPSEYMVNDFADCDNLFAVWNRMVYRNEEDMDGIATLHNGLGQMSKESKGDFLYNYGELQEHGVFGMEVHSIRGTTGVSILELCDSEEEKVMRKPAPRDYSISRPPMEDILLDMADIFIVCPTKYKDCLLIESTFLYVYRNGGLGDLTPTDATNNYYVHGEIETLLDLYNSVLKKDCEGVAITLLNLESSGVIPTSMLEELAWFVRPRLRSVLKSGEGSLRKVLDKLLEQREDALSTPGVGEDSVRGYCKEDADASIKFSKALIGSSNEKVTYEQDLPKANNNVDLVFEDKLFLLQKALDWFKLNICRKTLSLADRVQLLSDVKLDVLFSGDVTLKSGDTIPAISDMTFAELFFLDEDTLDINDLRYGEGTIECDDDVSGFSSMFNMSQGIYIQADCTDIVSIRLTDMKDAHSTKAVKRVVDFIYDVSVTFGTIV